MYSKSQIRMLSSEYPIGYTELGYYDPLSIAGAVAGPIIGGIIGGDSSKQAAQTQATAATQGQDQALAFLREANQQSRGDIQTAQAQTRNDLTPYLNTGGSAGNNLNYLTGNTNGTLSDSTVAETIGMGRGSLLKPFGMQDFQESPAYQFNLQQGQRAIENASRKRGTYYAPTTLQDLSKFSQGLASNEYQNAFSNYNTNLNNIWNRLYSLGGAGQNAAVQQGGFAQSGANALSSGGLNTGQQLANNAVTGITGAGAANAAGQVGFGNAISGGLSGAYNNYLMNQLLQGQQQSTYAGQNQYGGTGNQIQEPYPGYFDYGSEG